MAARESGNAAELVMSTGVGSLPVAGAVSVSGVEDAVSLGWVPVVSDADGDVLSCVIESGPVHGVAWVASDCSSGSFVPAADWSGSDSFGYAVSDGVGSASGVVSVVVAPVNDVPVMDAVSVDVVAGSSATVVVSGSDVDRECGLSFVVSSGPAHGVVGAVSNVQCVDGVGSAEVVYTPEVGFEGVDGFEVTVSDPSGAVSVPGVVSVSVAAAQTDFVFAASADAYVSASKPTRNYGSATVLRVDGSPVLRSYVRFDVGGLSGAPVSVVLRVLVNSSSSVGFEVRVGGDGWVESGVTYASAPVFGGVVAVSGRVVSGQWVEVVLPASLFAGGDGSYSLVLTGASSTGISMAARESGNAAELVISTG